MSSDKNSFQVYSAASNIFSIVSTDNERDDTLIKSLNRSLEGLKRIKILYPRLLNEDILLNLADALMTLACKSSTDWVAYTIYDSKKHIVIQEWRYELRNSSDDSIDIPKTKLLSEIPFVSLPYIPSTAIFICHIFGNSFLSQEEQNLLEKNPIKINAYPNDTWWHSQTYSQSSYRIAQNNLSVINSRGVNREWEPVAKFPGKCIKGEVYKLELVFRPKELNTSEVSNQTPKQLLVVVTGQDFDLISDYYYNIEIPFERESEKAIFQLTPKSDAEWGEKEVIIDFFSEGRRIGNLVIKTKISNPRYEEQDDIVGSPISGEILNRASSSSLETVTLSGRTIRDTNDVRYDVFSRVITGKQIGTAKIVEENEIKDFIKKFENKTQRFVDYSSDDYYQNILIELQAIGNKLYNLFPQEFRDYFSNLDEGTIIYIHKVEELQCIPWEIIFDKNKEQFWGERFIITRLSEKGTSNNNGLSDKIKFFTNMVHFISTDISNDQSKIDSAKEDIKKNFYNNDYTCEINSSRSNLKQTLKQLSKVSIIHFTCHCVKNENRPTLALGCISKVVNEGLDIDMISILNLDKVTFIFANACSSETYTDWWGESINFGFACLNNGVQVFVGTIGIIPVRLALEFAKVFYEKLIKEQLSIGEAMRMTKIRFKNSKNPFWLFYCLYGDATLRLHYKRSDDSEIPENEIPSI
jgi:CHAT domain-containing protein